MSRQPGIGRSAGSNVVMVEAADPLQRMYCRHHLRRSSIGSRNRLIEHGNRPPPCLEQNCSRERIQSPHRANAVRRVGDRRRVSASGARRDAKDRHPAFEKTWISTQRRRASGAGQRWRISALSRRASDTLGIARSLSKRKNERVSAFPVLYRSGAPDKIRTCDLCLRRQENSWYLCTEVLTGWRAALLGHPLLMTNTLIRWQVYPR